MPRPGPRAVVRRVAPQPPGLGLALTGIEHRQRRVVGEHPWRGQHRAQHGRVQRFQPPAGPSHPVAECGTIELHTVPGEHLRLAIQRQASRAGESHPRALPEPYVNLSAHTAPSVRPWPYRSGQWANRSGDERTTRASQFRAPFGCCRRRLNLRRAHRSRKTSILRNVGYNADL